MIPKIAAFVGAHVGGMGAATGATGALSGATKTFGIVSKLAFLGNPITLAIMGIVAAIVLLVIYWDPISKAFMDFADYLKRKYLPQDDTDKG